MQGFIHNQKGGSVIGDIVERYVVANETIEAGSFVEFVKGLSKGSVLATSPVNLQFNTTAGLDFEAELLSENKIIVAYYDYYSTTTKYLKVRILTVNKNEIILGKEYTLNSIPTINIRIEVLNTNKAIIIYTGSSDSDYKKNGYAIGISITDDGIITHSDIITFSTNVGYFYSFELCKISSTAALAMYQDYSNSYAKGVVINYSSNNISAGAVTNLASVKADNFRATNLQDNELVMVYTNKDASSIVAQKLTINGNSISINFSATLSTYESYVNSSYTIIALAIDRILFRYIKDSICYHVVYKLYNDEFVPGNVLGINENIIGYLNVFTIIDENTVISFDDDNYYILDVRDTYLSIISNGKLPNDTSYEGTQYKKVADGRIILLTDTSPYIIGRILVVDGDRLTTEIIEGTFETQVRKATTSKADGVARTSGVGGTNTEHNQLIQVYVPKLNEVE